MFRNKIPEVVLTENPEASAFVDVLDGLQEYKTENINKALRVYNPILSLDKKWLIKQLEEFGVFNFPDTIPMEILVQFVGNISSIMGLRGSKLGVEFVCSLLTFGEVTVTDSTYYSTPKLFLLDSPNSALAVDDTADPRLYLVTNTSDLKDNKTVTIAIESPLWSIGASEEIQEIVSGFLEQFLRTYVPFSDSPTITVTYTARAEKFKHSLLNSFLI